MKIALDAMGGDHAPGATVGGAVEAVGEDPSIKVILVGDEASISNELSRIKHPPANISIRHASEVVEMHEPPSQAIRRKKDSSIRRALELVKDGEADGAVSAGNSGATMAVALLALGKSEGVDRPAIAIAMPTLQKPFVLIDAGANVDCNAVNLLQFALMGNAYSKHIMHRTEPRVALLSIGEEESKGNELTKGAFKLLKGAEINFTGNIEGKEIFIGNADVVVCDGFIGNVFLKASEGLAEVMMEMLGREVRKLAAGRLGYFFLKGALRNFRRETDYSEYGGAPLLGINGTCFISHGRSTPKAIKNAIKAASEFSGKRVYEIISGDIGKGLSAREGALAG